MQLVFEEPVNTIVGLGFLRPIRSVEEAYAFLMDWRGCASADRFHGLALKSVKAALAGEVEPETARGVVERFAQEAGLLAPTVTDVIAGAQAANRSGQLSQ